MARVFRHKYSRRLADGSMTQRTCKKWYIAYSDADGRRHKVPGFRDKRATQERANEIQKKVDRQKAGIIDAESLSLTGHLTAPIVEHIQDYETHLKAKGVSAHHRSETIRRLKFLMNECSFHQLVKFKPEPVQAWIASRNAEKRGARTINTYIVSIRAFVRWCLKTSRLITDPLLTVGKLDEAADKRRIRRALTEDEINRLLKAAEIRPVHDVLTIRRGKHVGKLDAKISDQTRADAERKGRQRRLIYMTLILTGLRKGELCQLKWSDLDIDGDQAWLTVRAAVSKNGKTETVPVRADLATELKSWRDEIVPESANEKVFDVPRDLVRILDRDLVAAGIARRVKGEGGEWRIDKRDSLGKTIDVHAFRHTTATFLAKSGVAPRTAQSIMRHSDIRLTLGTYTDPSLLNTASAVDALPTMLGSGGPQPLRATGTDGRQLEKLGVQLGQKPRSKARQLAISSSGRGATTSKSSRGQLRLPATLSTSSHGHSSKRASGLEPPTFSLEG